MSQKEFNSDWDQLEAAHESLREHMKMARAYRILLDECLFALNTIPRQKIPDGDGGNTYKLAAKIEAALKTYGL